MATSESLNFGIIFFTRGPTSDHIKKNFAQFEDKNSKLKYLCIIAMKFAKDFKETPAFWINIIFFEDV